MKPDRLDDTKLLKITERFGDHPLLTACQRAFKRYQANMAPLLFAPEEVFYEAAVIIDYIHKQPQTNEVQAYIADLWDNLRIKLSKWEKTATSDNLDMAVSAVLYTVAMAMERSWTTFYCFDVTRWLLQAIVDNMKMDYQEMIRVFGIFFDEADRIEQWINNASESCFCDEIESTLKDDLFYAVVCNPQKANVIIKRLHELMKDKSKPKDIIMPIRAAIDVGAIRRPLYKEFCSEFGAERVKAKSSFEFYTQPEKSPYQGAVFDAMKAELKKLLEE